MDRISLADAASDLPGLVDRISDEGTGIDLARGDEIVARLVPAALRQFRVSDVNRLFEELPDLGHDAALFADDLEKARAVVPPELSAWE